MIPANTLRDLEDYRDYGKPPGGFLRKVLENRALFDVIGHADAANAKAIKAITVWIYNEIPLGSWGTSGNVSEWIAKGGAGERPRLNVIQGGAK